MQRTLRPYMTAGVAVVGAGLIAVTPVGPPALDVQMRAVRLASADAALAVTQEYPVYSVQDLVTQTTANLQGLRAEYAANPMPVLTQAMANWTGYGQDFSAAFQTADANFMADIQELPTVLQNASTDLSQGDVFDAMTGLTQYVQSTADGVLQPVFQTGVQVAQEMSANLNTVVQGAIGFAVVNAQDVIPAMARQATGPWLSMLVSAPEYAPNAAITAAAGVAQDITTALSNGDYTTAWDDLLNAGPTILYGYLDGYPLNTAFAAPELAIRAGIPPEYGLLTNEAADGLRGFFQNHLDARLAIAADIGSALRAYASTPAAAAVDAHVASLDSLLTTVGTDLSTLLNNVWTDLGTMFDPGAATDISAQLGTDLGELGTNLSALFADLATLF